MDEVRSAQARSKALEQKVQKYRRADASALKANRSDAKKISSAAEDKVKKNLFCGENIEDIEDSLLNADEPSTVEDNRDEEGTRGADATEGAVGQVSLEESLLEEENQKMEE